MNMSVNTEFFVSLIAPTAVIREVRYAYTTLDAGRRVFVDPYGRLSENMADADIHHTPDQARSFVSDKIVAQTGAELTRVTLSVFAHEDSKAAAFIGERQHAIILAQNSESLKLSEVPTPGIVTRGGPFGSKSGVSNRLWQAVILEDEKSAEQHEMLENQTHPVLSSGSFARPQYEALTVMDTGARRPMMHDQPTRYAMALLCVEFSLA